MKGNKQNNVLMEEINMTRTSFVKKRILALVLMIVTAFTIIPTTQVRAAEDYNGGAAITEEEVTVYDGVYGTKIGTIYRHEGLTVLNYVSGNWVYVEYSTPNGAKRGYVDYSGGKLGFYASTCVAKVNVTSNVYYGTDLSTHLKTGAVYAGEYIAVLAKNGDWVYVEYNTPDGRKRGYMYYSNLTCYNRPAVFPDLYTYNDDGTSFYVDGYYTVFSGPGENYAKIGSVNSENVIAYQNIFDGSLEGTYIEYYVTGTTQKKSGFILYSY